MGGGVGAAFSLCQGNVLCGDGEVSFLPYRYSTVSGYPGTVMMGPFANSLSHQACMDAHDKCLIKWSAISLVLLFF